MIGSQASRDTLMNEAVVYNRARVSWKLARKSAPAGQEEGEDLVILELLGCFACLFTRRLTSPRKQRKGIKVPQ